MKLTYAGKTKDVYALDGGRYLLKFKDDVTGEGGVFDPGANTVGLTIAGMGRAGLAMSAYFFRRINDAGFATHFISADIEKAEMIVHAARPIGKGLEVICRYRATGSFMRRYGAYAVEGQPLDALVEMTIKDDQRADPPISRDALAALGILAPAAYDTLKTLARSVAVIVKDALAEKGLTLYDIKLEFGYADGELLLIDEISGGNMRVCKGGKIVEPLGLAQMLLQ